MYMLSYCMEPVTVMMIPFMCSLFSVSGFKSDVTVPVDDNEDSLTRSDSYENFQKILAAQELESELCACSELLVLK